MRILSILNVSNRENPGSDSGVIFHKLLFTECIKKGHKIFIASPFDLKIKKAVYVKNEPGKSKYDVRFRFDWNFYKKKIEEIKPEVIFCNQPELCSNFKALLLTMGLNNVKLITYYHYIPILEFKENGKIIWDNSLDHCGLAEIILFNILSALKISDLFFVTSKYSKELLCKVAKRYNINFDKKKIIIMAPPTDPFFITKDKKVIKPKDNYVLYNSRLYEQYGVDLLLDVIDHYKKETNIKFIVTDLFRNKSNERKKMDTEKKDYRKILLKKKNVIVRNDGDNRTIYRDEIILGSSLVFGPYRKNANWSMGMLDANMMGIPGIGPKKASFPEFMPSYLLYETKKDVIKLIDKLLNDDVFWKKASEDCKNKYLKYTPEETAKIFINSIKKLYEE